MCLHNWDFFDRKQSSILNLSVFWLESCKRFFSLICGDSYWDIILKWSIKCVWLWYNARSYGTVAYKWQKQIFLEWKQTLRFKLNHSTTIPRKIHIISFDHEPQNVIIQLIGFLCELLIWTWTKFYRFETINFIILVRF